MQSLAKKKAVKKDMSNLSFAILIIITDNHTTFMCANSSQFLCSLVQHKLPIRGQQEDQFEQEPQRSSDPTAVVQRIEVLAKRVEGKEQPTQQYSTTSSRTQPLCRVLFTVQKLLLAPMLSAAMKASARWATCDLGFFTTTSMGDPLAPVPGWR